ncbi:MAG: divergent polysaccharide deacetylase family protein [Candidatus Omnitrophica bacterium]|nr:divergent polysaccharide deacetylase family protein [Candidatus Omnitrophota bacterium]
MRKSGSRKKPQGYKTVIAILVAIILLQWLLIANLTKPKEKTKVLPPPKPVKVKPVVTPPSVKGKIAIVLDDWGYNEEDVALASRIRYPLTMAVLPNLAYSKQVARELHKNGFQIILHFPMEPKEKRNLEKNTILSTMKQSTVKRILRESLLDVPHAQGISNHMGSRITADKNIMGYIIQELKAQGLYFLDSYVSADSVCAQVAKQYQLKFAQRDIFLDNQDDPAYIKNQLLKLQVKARIRGSAIGIGHDRKETLAVLREVMPSMEKEGFRFVFVSDLVK